MPNVECTPRALEDLQYLYILRKNYMFYHLESNKIQWGITTPPIRIYKNILMGGVIFLTWIIR